MLRREPLRSGGALRGPLLYGAAAALLCATAIVSSWELSRAASTRLASLDPPVPPVAMPVQDATLDFAGPASLAGRYEAAPELLASGRAGTITAALAAGTVLTAGDVVYSVDGVPIRAYVGDTVLYRVLRAGDKGPDVSAAQALLNVLVEGDSRRLDVTGTFDSRTVTFSKAFERQNGLTATGVFDPSLFVRLPHDAYTVAASTLVLGAPAPGTGAAIAQEEPRLAAATLQAQDVPGRPEGTYVFVFEGRRTVVDLSGGTWSARDLEAADDVLASTDGAAAVVREGRVALADPAAGQAVAPTSIIVSSDGSRSCVATLDGKAVSISSVTVVGAESDGRALIRPTLATDAKVVVNPNQLRDRPTCA